MWADSRNQIVTLVNVGVLNLKRLLALFLCWTTIDACGDSLPADQWEEHLFPIIQTACMDCHAGDDAEGSLDLSSFSDVTNVANHRRQWQKIAARIRSKEMPPHEGPELNQRDRRRILDWIDHQLPSLACSHEIHAGPVTLRRLTRLEYKNTVRDLLGVDCRLADDFPADEVGYGFDNIGDVLSVSPLLLEKYLDSAESIAKNVIFDPAKHRIDLRRSGADLTPTRGSRSIRNAQIMTTNGRLTWLINIPLDGKYQIVVEAFGQHAGDDWIEMGLSAAGREVDTVEVKSERRKPSKHKFSIELKPGKTELGFSFNNDFYNPDHPVRSQRDRNLVVLEVAVSGPIGLTNRDLPEPHRRFMIAHPRGSETKSLSSRDCAKKILSMHGSRAFRREITDVEIDSLLRIFDLAIAGGESFEGAMQVVLQSILVSPHFLFKVQSPPAADGSPQRLNDYELATAVSYFLWGSMPDSRLFRLAKQNQLADPETLRREVRRMIDDPKSSWLIDNFVEQWLQLRLLENIEPDPKRFPRYGDKLRESMVTETKLLFSDVIKSRLSLTSLLTADYTFLNRTLARHYGLPTKNLRVNEFRRVPTADSVRRGLLTHASILTLTSNPTRTSPVKRGKWVLENLLADPPPPALPDVPPLDSQAELTGTLRQRMEQHRADPRCASCHKKMDAIGFALERFDAIGQYRDTEDGQKIDCTGQLPDGSRFEGARELQEFIANELRSDFIRCICEKLFTYAIGRGPQPTDECIIDQIAHQATKDDYHFGQLVLAIIQSEPFQYRSLNIDQKRQSTNN